MEDIKAEFAIPLLAAFAGAGSADDFCKYFVHRVIRRHEALGALMGLVGSDSKCHVVGKFGDWNLSSGAVFDLWSSTPIAEAIKTGRPVYVDTPKILETTYPDTDSHLERAKSYIYSPFESTSRAIGFFAFGFAYPQKSREVTEVEIQLASMAAEYISLSARSISGAPSLYKKSSNSVLKHEESDDLSNRQMSILQQMAEGKTNQQIGRNMNLSESTIKQESVRIFRKLGVPNRHEAADVAKQVGLI
jgi:DNA-binding NarL/FixJ family response regulator